MTLERTREYLTANMDTLTLELYCLNMHFWGLA